MFADPNLPLHVRKAREDAPPDPLREFGAEYRPWRRDTAGKRQPPAMLGLCRFVNGREVERGYGCPHFREPEGGQDG